MPTIDSLSDNLKIFVVFVLGWVLTPFAAAAQPAHHPLQQIEASQAAVHPGQKIYQQYCANCHAAKPLIPLGAPSFRQAEQWAPRLKQPQAQLWQHVEQGVGNMPPRGGCFECSDVLLREAIEYMLPNNHKLS